MEISGGTEQRISSLAVSLEAISLQQIETDSPYHHASVFSNDLKVSKNIPEIVKDLEAQTDPDLKVGFVIGSGGIFSLGPLLPQIDLWIVFDKSPKTIDMIRRYSGVVSNAEDPQQLIKVADNYGGTRTLNDERKSYDNYHYLFNPDSLEKTKQFLASKKAVFLNADLRDKDIMAKMRIALNSHQAKIAFANFTNVMEWMPGFYEGTSQVLLGNSVASLPFSKDCVFLYSVSAGRIGRSPPMSNIAVSLPNYLKASKFKQISISDFDRLVKEANEPA